jgi:hypothetical protein
MSGGSFDYAHIRVEQFAEELRAKIADNGKENDYGEKCEFSAQTITRLQSIAEDADRTAKLMKAAEWLYSGDTGEDDLAASVLGVCPEEYDAGRLAVQTIKLQDRVHTASGYTVLEAMENAEIFKVTPLHDGMFLVDVLCDYYFRAYLTKDQLLALAEELRAMACGHDFADAIRERKHK